MKKVILPEQVATDIEEFMKWALEEIDARNVDNVSYEKLPGVEDSPEVAKARRACECLTAILSSMASSPLRLVISELTPSDIGRWVEYTPSYSSTTRMATITSIVSPTKESVEAVKKYGLELSNTAPTVARYGRLKCWSTGFVFVVFNCDDDWDNYREYTGAACHPDDIRFVDIEKDDV